MVTSAKLQQVKTVRLPLVNTLYQRPKLGSAISAADVVGIGIVGIMIVGGSAVNVAARDQRIINCIPEGTENPYTGEKIFAVSKRPGFSSVATLKSGHIGNDVRIWSGKDTGTTPVSAFGNSASEIFVNTTSIGSITGITNFIGETMIGTTPTVLFPSSDHTAWFYSDGGSLTQIIDSDFPGNAGRSLTGGFAVMNGFHYIMDTTGRIYNSDLGSIANWTTDSYLQAQMYPDLGVGLVRYKDYIVAFGKESIEFFQDIGNQSGTPLKFVPNMTIRLGCIGPKALTEVEDTIAWVSSSGQNGIGVYLLDGGQPKRISNPSVDVQLQLASLSTIHITSTRLVGKSFVIVTTSSVTFVYCLEDQTWHEWASTTPLWHHLAGSTGSTSIIYSVSTTSTSGKLYKIDPINPVYQDDGSNFTTTIQTSKIDFGINNWKFLSKLTVISDIPTASCIVNISWSDDDYATFTTRTVDLNTSINYLLNLGKFRRRAFRITNSDSNFIRLEGLELQFKAGIH